MKHLLAIGLLLAALLPADAAVLAIGTEDITVVQNGTWAASTTAGNRNTTYARLILRTQTAASATIPNPTRLDLPSFTGQSDLWITGTYYLDTNLSIPVSGAAVVEFFDGATERLMVRTASASANSFKISKRNAAGTITDLATATNNSCGLSTVCKLDVHVVYGTSGSVDVYANTALIATYSGDVTTDSATTLSKVSYGSWMTSSGGSGLGWSEMIAATNDTRSMHVYTCSPVATGNTQAWTGSVGNVNPNTANDSAFNYSGTNGQIQQWTNGCTSIASTVAILSVQQAARISKGTSGPQTFRWSQHIGASDYDNGADITLTNLFANYIYDWGALSPATSAPWAASEINSGYSNGIKSAP